MTTNRDPRIPFMQRMLEASSHAYKLAGLLCWKYGNKRGEIFPSQETLAADLGVMERTVRTLLKEELIPRGLRVSIRRGPKSGNNQSHYTFDGPIIPEARHLNTEDNSGSQKPKSRAETASNLGVSAQQFRCPDVNNSGSQTPPNQKREPKDRTIYPPSPLKGEQRFATAAADEGQKKEAAREEVKQEREDLEMEVSSWKAQGLLNDDMAVEFGSFFAEVMDGLVAGTVSREEANAAFRKIRAAVARRASRHAEGVPDGLAPPLVSPSAPLAPEQGPVGRPLHGAPGGPSGSANGAAGRTQINGIEYPAKQGGYREKQGSGEG